MSLTIRPALALAAIATLTLSACSEPAGDPMGGIPANDYVLVGIGNGTVPLRNITLTTRPEGVSGRGPCNGYAAKNTVPLPAVAFEPLQTTGVIDCKDLARRTALLRGAAIPLQHREGRNACRSAFHQRRVPECRAGQDDRTGQWRGGPLPE